MPLVDAFADLVRAYLGQLLGFFALGATAWALTRRSGWLDGRRIAVRGRPADAAQLRHEVLHSCVALAAATAQASVVMALHERGLVELPEGPGAWGAFGVVVGCAALVAFNDLWFYGVHRLLHTRWLFKHVHSVHHRSVDVSPFSSYSFHFVEAILLTGWIVPMLLLVPVPMPVLAVVQVVGLLNNLMAHLGYELLPRWWARTPLLRWSNTATFHSLHHTRFNGNYGLFSRVWDRVFGTELDGYEAAFEAAHAPGYPTRHERPVP